MDLTLKNRHQTFFKKSRIVAGHEKNIKPRERLMSFESDEEDDDHFISKEKAD